MADEEQPTAGKKKSSQKTPKAVRTRELIYRSAMELLIERGFKATTIRDICSRANVSVGTFYLYFESKYAILFEIVRKIDHYFVDEVQPKLEGMDTAERICKYFEEYGNYVSHSNFDTTCVLFSVDNIWVARYRPMHRVLTAILTEGQLKGEITREASAEDLCHYFFVAARGIVFTWCTTKAGFELSDTLMRQVRLQLRSVLLQPSEPLDTGSPA